MPKCLHPPCPNQVADSLYCDRHKYIPQMTTNLSVEAPSSLPSMSYEFPPQSAVSDAPRAGGPAPVLMLALAVLILAILVVGVIVILKLIF